ncbi:MAG TPA: hypothetical protein VLF63_02715 [Patescibacteria group bacterium]|nr:hypothetical protein [Patescibacteria group bacterium]
MWRYFVWLIAVIGLVFVLVLLLTPSKSKAPIKTPLYNYANTDVISRLTIDGPINSEEKHQTIEISVDKSSVTIDQFQGYNHRVVKQQTYASSPAAYDNFLHALYHAGFTLGISSGKNSSELGYCPLGDRYVFELINGGSNIERFWATNCSGTPKTFNGNISLNLTLFQAQVPNYSDFIQNVSLL